ncbi:MAG: type I-C CRISPR-associated protein Cas8c/Csd1 [Candidatus Abyssobacteria bacterium SURF_5]|uniref:Type I-C CRISPR-associated protein Cas8c/Csd1 n=1 Tax=Abyssobacteria bacterium (strain SURF_5) TaxID=2093360 RepID=A0A3A4ND59_ABYX5|nr:MAG: type I-C CRISPR-associated protein Cas8c/Csd1 [Candidatus Abyssubacteria bacterium SURF_5]
MILQALVGYYRRISLERSFGVAPRGFEVKEIPFIITISKEGQFLGIDDTRDNAGKKGARKYVVPKSVKKSVNIAANLLWGTPAYVFGMPKPDETKAPEKLTQRAEKQRQSFISKIRETFSEPVTDRGVAAVLHFLEGSERNKVFGHPLWPEIQETGANLSFKVMGENILACQSDAVAMAIDSANQEAIGGRLQPCLVMGELDVPSRLHAPIRGVRGAQSSGANIVSFNLNAFNSYGKEQGYNAPVGAKAEHAYTTALNLLLAKDSRQRIQVGDATTVFWAEQAHKMEEWFADFFGELPADQSEQDNEAVRTLFLAPRMGAPPLEDDYTRFFVLGLAPNASRIAVRFWYEGTVGEVARNIKQHFNDCSIVHGPKERDYLSIFRLLVSTAQLGKAENIQPLLAGEMMKSILNGTPYPATLLSSAIRRIRAEQSKNDANGKPLQNVTYPRACLIKGVLVRNARYYDTGEKEVGMSLDRENANAGYLLGRLFAVLEKAQERANPGINATIRDRYYGAASSTPLTAFPHLLKLKNHHISKLESRGEAVNLEKQIGEIMAGVKDFPALLNLQDQGKFAIGYYHQREEFFKKRDARDGEEDHE